MTFSLNLATKKTKKLSTKNNLFMTFLLEKKMDFFVIFFIFLSTNLSTNLWPMDTPASS